MTAGAPACPVCHGDRAVRLPGGGADACPACARMAEIEWQARGTQLSLPLPVAAPPRLPRSLRLVVAA